MLLPTPARAAKHGKRRELHNDQKIGTNAFMEVNDHPGTRDFCNLVSDQDDTKCLPLAGPQGQLPVVKGDESQRRKDDSNKGAATSFEPRKEDYNGRLDDWFRDSISDQRIICQVSVL
jgi:hypothetical protein